MLSTILLILGSDGAGGGAEVDAEGVFVAAVARDLDNLATLV